jgi:hypothetical protein
VAPHDVDVVLALVLDYVVVPSLMVMPSVWPL